MKTTWNGDRLELSLNRYEAKALADIVEQFERSVTSMNGNQYMVVHDVKTDVKPFIPTD